MIPFVSKLIILVFGTLYPAYASFKVLKNRNIQGYVKWLIYWIGFALFTYTESFTDIFLSWFPFYYEIKTILFICFVSPLTQGYSMLYHDFVYPILIRKDQEIDACMSNVKEQSYKQILNLGVKCVNLFIRIFTKYLAIVAFLLKSTNSIYQDELNATLPEQSPCNLPCEAKALTEDATDMSNTDVELKYATSIKVKHTSNMGAEPYHETIN